VKLRLDIPDKTLTRLKKKARQEGVAVNDLVLRTIEAMLANAAKVGLKRSPPVIESKRPGSLHLDNASIYELIDFP
jgi:uncharacterized protein YicC (UPF0701 family)